MSSGEKKGWDDLRRLSPENVCESAGVVFDNRSETYHMKSFGTDITVFPKDEMFSGNSNLSEIILQRLGYFSRLSMISYLVNFKNIPLSGELLKPLNLKGGDIFFRGSHLLPLDKLAERYGNDADAFLKKGKELGGEELKFGDASLKLHPFPKFPVILILWQADEEFPARFDLLLDSSSELQLPIDIIWSIAMMSLLIMM
ncbi:MAG: DUF3786 domain-containing protein [Thermodesulfovibrionia bacterium]|nr:DUF3786 domain-containing protein [Thermodesulfovibrionia bacterium]